LGKAGEFDMVLGITACPSLSQERLQDGLGDLNDIAVHEQCIAAIGIRPRRSNHKRAFAAGLLTGREDARIDAAMAAATQAYADLAKVKPFWP
jgi:hypothetical protein